MKDPRDVIIKPVVSEKSYGLIDSGVYTFIVAPGSNKTEIRQAIESIFDVKVKQARKFLTEGHKVKVSLLFRGREITHPELGRAILNRFMTAVEDIGSLEQAPMLTGRDLNIMIGTKKDAKTQDS